MKIVERDQGTYEKLKYDKVRVNIDYLINDVGITGKPSGEKIMLDSYLTQKQRLKYENSRLGAKEGKGSVGNTIMLLKLYI